MTSGLRVWVIHFNEKYWIRLGQHHYVFFKVI